MKSVKAVPRPKIAQSFELSLFCGQIDDAYRVHVWPGWLPGYLRDCFDANGEAYPVYLDLEDLDRQMKESGVEYVKIESPIGGYQLTAKGNAATVLSVWLSQSFASGRRVSGGVLEESSSKDSSGMTG